MIIIELIQLLQSCSTSVEVEAAIAMLKQYFDPVPSDHSNDTQSEEDYFSVFTQQKGCEGLVSLLKVSISQTSLFTLCEIIRRMFAHNSSNITAFGQSGGCAALASLVHIEYPSDLLESICQTIIDACIDNCANVTRFGDAGCVGLANLLSRAKQLKSNALEKACLAVKVTCSDNYSNAISFGKAEGCAALSSLIQKQCSSSEATLINEACSAIIAVCSNDSNRSSICYSGGCIGMYEYN